MDFIYERIGEIIGQLKELAYPVRQEIEQWKGKEGHFPVTDCLEVKTHDWPAADPAKLGSSKGAWFGLCTEIVIPKEMEGGSLELFISTGREGEWDATNPQMAAYVDGQLAQGLDVNHRSIYLGEEKRAGEHLTVFLSVYTGEEGSVREWHSSLRMKDKAVYEFYYDCLVPWKCLELMEEDSREYGELLGILNRTVNCLDMRKTDSREFAESIRRASEELRRQTEKLPASPVTVSCVGHTHIDVAWLWTLEITREKAARSFSTVFKLMERYPEYLFMSSQPQLYMYVRENQPELYKKIKKRAEEGRWEPEGAMFLEADCNLTSGESLVRQCLYGKMFFREEFGADSRILWLPDVFGYSAALPQIMEKCGIDSFMTTKISWNETNKIPFDTFWWEGIDGTKVLTHFVTTRDYEKNGKRVATNNEFNTSFSTNYNGYIEPSQIKGAWQRYQQKALNDNILVSYGYGDGGGGPTEQMLETGRRLGAGKYGCPKVKLEKAGDFFERLHRTADDSEFPVWSGELYLEYHRGTYTSMEKNKRSNRMGEFALLNSECWSELAMEKTGRLYPAEEISKGWEILMRNQFHDILPGSAVREVYEDSEREYRELAAITAEVENEALECLAKQILGEEGDILIFNSNGVPSSELVEIPRDELPGQEIKGVLCGNEIYPVQYTERGTALFQAKDVPPKGWKRLSPVKDSSEYTADDFYCTEEETVTPYYYLKWNDAGQISSFYDKKAGRELLQPGKCGNVLMTYEDKPHKFDNWNLFEYYREKQWPVEKLVSRKIIEQGPVRMALELSWVYLDSSITEVFYFYPGSPRIDIHAHIDWQEDQILLKALFPLDINTCEASYEIQYGNVKRATTANNSWEQAMFEVCFQKWMDISEYDYGVSFISDCKYGAGVRKNEVGLTLLKSGLYPNPEADRGRHDFVYSVFPHRGSWQEAGTVEQAYGLNNPPKFRIKKEYGGKLEGEYAKVQTGNPNIIAEVLKRSEDGQAEILRLYECWNRRTRTQLAFGEEFQSLYLCNMLEEEECKLAEKGCTADIEFAPFEIKTLKIIR
ncbi:alpha-mannosidase [Murimonas intestini]|uniref:alpha-mannosidase n=1 Tax=Murimonas intestini TaxID=1337051 RepID=UPI0011DE5478|nr:glycoside hydrolase family 38 C-terminal domain-containing protein [Murimonas intestini]